MNKNIQKNRGSVVGWVIAIVVLVVAVGIYFVAMNKSNSGFDVPSPDKATIMVPQDITAYEKAMDEYVSMGGKNPAVTWLFVKKTISIAPTQDIFGDTIELAAEQIPTQAGTSSLVTYIKVVDGTAYVLLKMDIDGWAGVSFAIAKVHPLVEKTLLQYPDIKAVKFGAAPGDSVEQIQNEYMDNQISKTTTIHNSPSITSITPSSASIGQAIVVKGSNLAGFEGDKNLWIKNSQGIPGIIYSDQSSTDKLISFKLGDKYCTVVTEYSGEPCQSYISIVSGNYQIYAQPWGTKSNAVNFTVKPIAVSNGQPAITVISPNGGEIFRAGTKQNLSVSVTGDKDKIGSWIQLMLSDQNDTNPSNRYSLGSFSSGSIPGMKTFSVLIPTRNPGNYKIYAILSGSMTSSGAPCPIGSTGCASEPVVQDTDPSDNYFTITN